MNTKPGKGNVLNAFRHQRKELAATVRALASIRTSAQRLSASTEGTHKRVTFVKIGHKCSTPFGINGRNSPPHIAEVRPAACRSTPFGINGRNSTVTFTLNRPCVMCS